MTDDVFDVCVVGSANLDLVATTETLPAPGVTVLGTSYAEHPGGKGLNQAVAAARAGARVAGVGAVGLAAAGRGLLDVLVAEHIDATGVQQVGTTGRALIGVSAAGENSIIVVPGANAMLTAEHVRAALPRARVVLVQLEIPLPAVGAALATGRAMGATTVLNPAPAPAAPLPAEVLQHCDLVVPNEHEADAIGGAPSLLAEGATTVIVTRGAAGISLVTSADTVDLRAFTVEAVDTTAAGDAFCGALCAELAAGADLAAAVRVAMAAGALATTVAGAVPSLPRRAAIDELLSAAG